MMRGGLSDLNIWSNLHMNEQGKVKAETRQSRAVLPLFSSVVRFVRF